MEDLSAVWARRIVNAHGHELRDLDDAAQREHVEPLLAMLGADARDLEQIMVQVRSLLRGESRPADRPHGRGMSRMYR